MFGLEEAKLFGDLEDMGVNRDGLRAIHREKSNTIRNFAANTFQLNQLGSYFRKGLSSEPSDPVFAAFFLYVLQAFHNVRRSVTKAKLSQFCI